MELNFEKLFKLSVFCLRTTGAHPEEPKNMRWVAQFVFQQGIFTLCVVMIIYSVFVHDIHNEIVNLCGNGSWIFVFTMVTFKYTIMITYQKTFQNLFNYVREDYTASKILPAKEQELVIYYAKKGRMMALYWLVLSTSAFSLFTIKPLLIMLFYTIFSEFRYVPMLELTLPDAFQSIGYDTLFIVSYILLSFFTIYTAFVYTGVVPLGLIFMLHACGQLEIMKLRVLELFPKDASLTPADRAKRLKTIAQDLQKIYDFVDDIKVAYKLMYELSMKGSSIIIPSLVFVCIETTQQGSLRLDFVTILCGAVMQSSFPCYFGDMLQEKSNDLREAVYFSGWECVWDRRARTSLIILMTRMQRGIAINSIFRVICLDSLTDVFKQAYTLFSVMNAAWT